jgi:hypothetical protein
MIRKIALAALILASTVGIAQAGNSGATFAVLPTTTANTGDVFTSTSFGLDDLYSVSGSGTVLSGVTFTSLGATTFSTTSGIDFTLAGIGSFTSTSVLLDSKGDNSIAYYDLGKFTPDGGSALDASFIISFGQTGGAGLISGSAVLSIPPAAPPVPEPSSVVLGLTGLAIGGAVFGLRRRSR